MLLSPKEAKKAQESEGKKRPKDNPVAVREANAVLKSLNEELKLGKQSMEFNKRISDDAVFMVKETATNRGWDISVTRSAEDEKLGFTRIDLSEVKPKEEEKKPAAKTKKKPVVRSKKK